MSVQSFFRRLARNDDSQLLPTVATPPPSPSPPLHRPPKQLRSRPTNIPLRDISLSPPHPPLSPLPLSLRDPDAFQVLAREEQHLRQSLQAAIDAQSEGLLAGFAASDAPDAAAAASLAWSKAETTSPTGRRRRLGIGRSEFASGSNGVVIPVRQPAPQRLGLQGARREISRAMAQLEGLKSHEGELLEAALVAHEEDMATVEALGQKREGLEASIRAIETEDSSRHVQDLCAEERSLDEEIRTLETQLVGMKTRHRHLRAEIAGLDNRVQSQLSSYRAALALAEKETREFLARPPSGPNQTNIISSTKIALISGGTKKANNQQSLWDLPAGRRTLPMAQEQFRDEQRMLLKRIAEVDEERTALEEGKHVWADVVQEVTSVEQLLRDEMQRLDQSMHPQRGLPPESPTSETAAAAAAASARARARVEAGVSGDERAEGEGERDGEREKDNTVTKNSMHAILQHIDTARTQVEQHLRTSVGHRWGLLVCCVGAELEALVQGSAVLRATLGEDEGVGGGGREGRAGRMGVDGPDDMNGNKNNNDDDDDDDDDDLDTRAVIIDTQNPDPAAGTVLRTESQPHPPHQPQQPHQSQQQRHQPHQPHRHSQSHIPHQPRNHETTQQEEEVEEEEEEEEEDGPGADLLVGF